jgi:hypothetical protein
MRFLATLSVALFALAVPAQAGEIDIDMKKVIVALDIMTDAGCDTGATSTVDKFLTLKGFDGLEDFRTKHPRLYAQFRREMKAMPKRQVDRFCESLKSQWELAQ